MNDDDTNDAAELAAAALDMLKSQADQLSISYHPSIGADKLREKIQAKLAETSPVVTAEAEPQEESAGAYRLRKREEALEMLRIRVTCMNPTKKDIDGEIFTVANSVIPTIKKYVPFNSDEGWHVPRIIYNMIKARKCQVFVQERSKNGVSMRRPKLINEFSVEVLEPLTEAELKDLAQRQAMAQGI